MKGGQELLAELRRQLDEVASVIGTVEFIDPPDGGSVTLAEQVRRMREQLDEARAESAGLRAMLREADRNIEAAKLKSDAANARIEKLEEALAALAADRERGEG